MIKSKITLKQMEALVSVADTGTFRKAAAALGTTQPNISVRIAAMEETLGVVLMHRDAGSVQLTEKGDEVLAAARQVLLAAEALLDTAGRQDLIEDRLRLGVTELVAATWLHAFLRQVKANYPAIRVELTVDLAYEIENHLTAGQLDLAILTGPFRTEPTGLILLGSCRYGWVATPEKADLLGASPTVAQIFAEGILTHGRHTRASVALRRHLESKGLRADQIVHSSSLSSALGMAVDDMGVALLPKPLFEAAVAAGELVELDPPWEPAPLEFFARFDAKRAPRFVADMASMAHEVALEYENKKKLSS